MKKHKFFAVFTAVLLAFTVFGCKQNDDSNPEKCMLTYDSNGGSGEMKSTTGEEGTEITLTANTFTKIGYTFTEWNTKANGSGDKYADKEKIKLTANTTLYAQWTANTYKVTFDANGGSVHSGDAPAEIQATYDKEFALPENTFTKIGYNFAGWNTKADDSGTKYEANTKVKNLTAENNATVTLYAQWADRGTHKINYELNGGNHIDTQKEQFKETEDVTLGTAEKTGYTFGGWYEAEDSSGTAVTSWNAGEKTGDVTLYAQWTANIYKVTFDKNANDVTGDAPAEIQATYDKEFALPENTFTKIGYNFAGWNTKADGSGTDYEAKSSVKNLIAENGATVTLYAKWEAIEYKITYELDGGTNVTGNPESYTIEDSITLKDPTKDGYTFDGWYTDNSFTEESKVTEIKKGSIGERTLYAKWTANTYTVSFDANGGTGSMTPQAFTYGTSQALNENTFTRTDYDFVGWATSANGNVTYKDSQDYSISAENVTLYAIWRDIISFKKIQTVSINGSETWTPESNVFVSGRVLDIKAFWMSDHEVTQAEWKDVMGSVPSDNTFADGNADNNPVNRIGWYDAIVYCNKRSIKEGLTPCYTINGSTNPNDWGDVPTLVDATWNAATCNFTANGYRLPTEAEWEWAARGGQNYKYAGSNNIDEVAWYRDNTNGTGTREVKTKNANGYELYDMSGNVFEWCWDRWNENISSSTPEAGTSSGFKRCLRGGSWYHTGDNCVVAFRYYNNPDNSNSRFGLRVVRTAE